MLYAVWKTFDILTCAEEIFRADGGVLTTWLRETGVSKAQDMELESDGSFS